jgi:predicted RNA-binding Zn-ribbon protein involved in translation (DUF1610 family)
MNIEHVKLPLTAVRNLAAGKTLAAPPVLNASSNTLAFTCAQCGTVLLEAEQGQIHGVVIECTNCGASTPRNCEGTPGDQASCDHFWKPELERRLHLSSDALCPQTATRRKSRAEELLGQPAGDHDARRSAGHLLKSGGALEQG